MKIVALDFPVHDLSRQCAFYCDALGFEPRAETANTVEIELGGTRIRLRRTAGRPIPGDSRSNDHWFRHIAISVRRMEPAYRHLRATNVPFVSEPVHLPAWNATAAGIVAVYLRDPEGHPVELIEFPPDKGHDELRDDDKPCYLGIDHTAIVVAQTARSEAFYRERCGLAVESRSRNFGREQARLSGIANADLRITSLRDPSGGIGIELLDYATPVDGRAMPADTSDDDLWSAASCASANGAAGFAWSAPSVADPDGHRVRFFGNHAASMKLHDVSSKDAASAAGFGAARS